jgi:hypothetical protein
MTQGGSNTHTMIEAAISCGSYDSVLGDREASVGTYREFIFYQEGQVYPEYLVRYTRRFGDEAPKPLEDEVLPEKVPKMLVLVAQADGEPERKVEYHVSQDLMNGTLQFVSQTGSKICADSERQMWECVANWGTVIFRAPYAGPIPPTDGWASTDEKTQYAVMRIEYPPEVPPPLRRGYIENVAAGLVMEIPGAKRQRGVGVGTWTKNGGVHQLWEWKPNGMIVNEMNGLALGVSGFKKNRGQPVVTWDAAGADKFWEVTPKGIIESKWCGLAMGIAGGKRVPGGQIVTWSKDPAWDKVWKFTPHPKA